MLREEAYFKTWKFVLWLWRGMLSSSANISSIMADELKFQQRWEFRRKEDEVDSSDDLKSGSTGELALKKHNLLAALVSVDNDETSNNSKLEQTSNGTPDFEAQTEHEQAKEKKTTRRRRTNQAKREVKRDSHEKIKRKKQKNAGRGNAAMDDVRSFTDSLLEDLRLTRENLFVWMREEVNKLMAGTAPKRRRRNGKKVQVQHQDNLEEDIQEQDMNNNMETVQVQQQNNFGKDNQVQHQDNEKNTQVQHRHQGKSKTGTRARKSSGGPSQRLAKSKKVAAESKNDCQAVDDDQVDCGNATGIITSTEKDKGESLALTVNSNIPSASTNQNAQMHQPKSVVLAIRAQNSKDKSPEKSSKGKKISDSNKKSGYSQGIGSMTSTEKDTAEGMRLSSGQSFPSISCNQVASSMYLTLPTVLATPYDSSNRLETSLCNYNQPRVTGNITGVNLERSNQMLDPSTQYGYLTSIQQPEERNGNFAQPSSRIMTCFDHSTTPTSSTGTGFPVPLHQNMDDNYIIPNQFRSQNLPRDSSNTLGLRMNGGALTFSTAGYTLSDHNFVGNTLQSQSNHKDDGNRLMPYRIPTIQDSYVFPK